MFHVPYTYAKVNAKRVERKAQQATVSPVGLRRFSYMRFYPARNTLPEEPGLLEEWFSTPEKPAHVRALAIYFLNMQISMHFYQQNKTPSQLTLNYLGVLDGLVGGLKIFDTSKASSFYKKNKKEVDAFLKEIRGKQWPAPSQAQINAWLKLLEKQPRHSGKSVYLFSSTNYLQTPIPTQEVGAFRTALATALQQGGKKVITYEKAEANLEDLDNKFVSHPQRIKRTYRWIKDECYYLTYTLGRLLADQIASKKINGYTHVYVLTALPKSGNFLKPAAGSRFTLANGSSALHWRYHTALLVVWPSRRGYITMVLDSFLGGKEPVSLDAWLAHFHANTVFSAVPFLRNKTIEDAIKTPKKVEGSSVWIGNAKYEPAPVEN